MITSRFLDPEEYFKYGEWMKSQSNESRKIFFGYNVTDEQLDKLVDQIVREPEMHHFLVLESRGNWVGTLHLADTGKNEVEFGFMLDPEYRGRGLGDRLMDEGLLWARNRGYSNVFLHCVSHNTPIQKLCRKHGLDVTTEYGESETKMPLPSPDFYSLTREVSVRNRQIWRTMLQTTFPVLEVVEV